MQQNEPRNPVVSRRSMLQHAGLFLSAGLLFAAFRVLTGSGSSTFGPAYDYFLNGMSFGASLCFLSLAGLTIELGGTPVRARPAWLFALTGAGALLWIIFCVTQMDKIIRG